MTLPELRAKLVEGIDRLLAHPLFVQGEDAQLLRAIRAAVLDGDSVVAAVGAQLRGQPPEPAP